MKFFYTLSLFTIIAVFPTDSLSSQIKTPPISVSSRKSFLQGSYVLQIQNSSNEDLDLWLQAKGKTTQFALSAGKMKEFGWAQGYKFDANNAFLIGGKGYNPISKRMPENELSPWRIGFSKEGGLSLSLSQSFLQNRLPKYLDLPIKEKPTRYLEISLSIIPKIILNEGSDRIYTDATLKGSLFSGKARFPIVASASFIPSYVPASGEVTATEIRIENIDVKIPNTDMSIFPKEWLDETNRFVNNIMPALFSKYVIYKIEKKWIQKLAKSANLRTKVIDGRLELIIL